MTIDQTTVLHVEKDSPSRDLTKTYLERHGESLSIVPEATVEAGFDRLEQQPVDCIVAGYDLPKTNGLAFLEDVRSEYPSIPFVLYSPREPEQIAEKALDAGADDYVQRQVGSAQYPILANRILTLVEHDAATQRLADLERDHHVADGGAYTEATAGPDEREESITLAVVGAVADRENTDPVDLPPLAEYLDPDALDGLFPTEGDDCDSSVESLTFTYHGYSVTVTGDGRVTLDR